jgi:hypothetical protein
MSVTDENPPRSFARRGTRPFDAAYGVALDELRLRRTLVEGFFGLGKPLHRTSCGPPPLQIQGRIL